MPVNGRRFIRAGGRRWAVVGSILLHALALARLLVGRRPDPPMPVAPSYDLIFENGGSSTPPTAPDLALDQPSEAPADDLPPPPIPEPLTPSPEVAPPETVPPEVVAPEPMPPEPVPFLEPIPERLPTSEPPMVRLAEPEPMSPALTPQTLAPDLPDLVPPPPLPPVRPQQQQAQPRPTSGGFPPPIDLNYGPASARAPAPRVAGSSRAIDLSLGAPKPGPNKSEAFFDIRAANIGADWAQGLAAYWRRHRYYPQQAAENNEDGTVQIEIVVNRQGRVTSVAIQRRSGSTWLDMAALGTWRNAQLAPLPYENTDPTITIPLTINYVLIRR